MSERSILQKDFLTKEILETKTSRIDDLLQEKLENAIHKQTSKVRLNSLVKIACEYSPVDLAIAASHLPPAARPILFENLPEKEAKCQFLTNTGKDTRLSIFRFLKDVELKKILEKMPPDDAIEILEDLTDRRCRRIMNILDSKKAVKINELKKHSLKSAGRLMSLEFFSFKMDTTIGQACKYIRDNPRIDFTKGIFILNDAKELQGFIPSRNMIINDPDLPLRQVMRPVLHKVSVDATREEVIEIFERYKIPSLPVVDMDNYIIGVITQEDVVEAMEDVADETMARIGGTGDRVSVSDPLLKRFKTRAPWLFVTLFAGLINVAVMSSFEKQEGQILTFVMFFVPLITGMSGNIGIQCSTVLVRSMAMGMFSSVGRKTLYQKELLIGVFLGSIFGVLCGLVVYFLGLLGATFDGVSPICVGSIVGLGLIGACFAGTILGVMSPLFFMRIGVDPAVSSGPIVTAFNDFLSMTIYFLIASALSLILV